jgi:hypothetical protein
MSRSPINGRKSPVDALLGLESTSIRLNFRPLRRRRRFGGVMRDPRAREVPQEAPRQPVYLIKTIRRDRVNPPASSLQK